MKASPDTAHAAARADVKRAAIDGCDADGLDRVVEHVAARRDGLDGRLLVVRVIAGPDAAAYEWTLERNTQIAGATVIRFETEGGTISATDFVPTV